MESSKHDKRDKYRQLQRRGIEVGIRRDDREKHTTFPKKEFSLGENTTVVGLFIYVICVTVK